MNVFLLVLKILGLTILGILGLLLLIILLLLFVPVRYRINAEKHGEDIKASVRVTWLLHFICIKVDYYKELFYRLKVFLFTIKKSDNLKKPKKTDNIKAEAKESASNKITDNAAEEELKEIEIKPYSVSKEMNEETTDEEQSEEELIDEEPKLLTKIRIILEKIIDFIFNIEEKIVKITDKAKEAYENIDYYIDAVNDERNKATISLVISKLSIVLKNIKPKKISGSIKYGSTDPYDMGKVMTIYSILFPLIHDKIQMVPDYENDIMDGDIYIKGRITLAVVVYALIKVYFNKDFRRMIKIFKRE